MRPRCVRPWPSSAIQMPARSARPLARLCANRGFHEVANRMCKGEKKGQASLPAACAVGAYRQLIAGLTEFKSGGMFTDEVPLPDRKKTAPTLEPSRSQIPAKARENEDAFLCDVERGLFLVADGMGGKNAEGLRAQRWPPCCGHALASPGPAQDAQTSGDGCR